MARIVIIGGGIGGLAAAGCLRVRGIEADIYERAAELREVGAALALWPNATRVMKRLGVLEELMRHGHVPPAGALRSAGGSVLKKMVQLNAEAPTVFAHRAEVHRALLSAIPGERVHLNKTFMSMQRQKVAEGGSEKGTVRAIFADGTDSGWADGMIGADGIHSAVREATLGDGPPVYRGYVAWRGVATAEQFVTAEEVVGETWGRGQRFGFIPLGEGRVGWWATANKPGAAGRETCLTSREEWKRELLERFGKWHEPIPRLLEATPAGAILCNAMEDRPMPRPSRKRATMAWGRGPLTLLGDAAHPTTPNLGQGACMAIEDAAVVAHAVAAVPSVEAAFRVYEQTRHARTSMIVRESLKFGRLGQWENSIACGLRNFAMRFAPASVLRKQFQELWFYDAWETPLVAPRTDAVGAGLNSV